MQTTEMEQDQTFLHGTYSNLTSFFIGHNILKYFNDFYDWHLSISSQKKKHKQVKRNKNTRDMCKSDNIFPYLQRSTLFK